ncbi:MAG: hypothetical protein FLDDKLPJ_02646 [Phycisphaerae bacterium]|nr:hypothetical protein [Phycisphaerae bacterium]
MGWHVVKTSPFGSLTEPQLEQFERAIGAILPSDYRAFLLEHNGPDIEPRDFHTSDGDVDSIVDLYGLHDGPSYRRLDLARRYYDESRMDLDLWPIADDPGGNAICIGIRGWRRGRIFFWDHETQQVTDLAESFDDFLDSLFEWIDPNESRFDKILRTNDAAELRQWLENGMDLEDRDQYGRTPVENAAIWGRTEMVRMLLDAGAQPGTSRVWAVQNGHQEVLALLDARFPPS